MKKFLLFIALSFISINTFATNVDDKNDVRKIGLPGTIVLTFDDGPNPIYTPQILAILKKYNVKATFFVVGKEAQAYPQLIKMIHADGHVIAVHSQTHPNLTKISEAQLQTEVTKPKEIVTAIIGVAPKCLRYPFNATNDHVRDVIREHGMTPMTTGDNSYDYKQPGVNKIVLYVLNHLHAQQVIVMHDGFAHREQTVAALPQIIEGIKKKGYGFSTVCE